MGNAHDTFNPSEMTNSQDAPNESYAGAYSAVYPKILTEEGYYQLLKIVKRASKSSCCLCCDSCLACDALELLRAIGEE